MFSTLRKNAPRNVFQSNVGTITSPLSVPHNWATFTSDDCSTTVTISWRQSTFVFRYSRFTSPKHQSQLNLVWPVIRNDRVMFLWRLSALATSSTASCRNSCSGHCSHPRASGHHTRQHRSDRRSSATSTQRC